MRYFILLLSLGLIIVAVTNANASEDDENSFCLWRYVAASDTIVKGVLRVPVSEISKEELKISKSQRITIDIEEPELCKGTCDGDKLTFKHTIYLRPDYDHLPLERLIELNGKTVIVFLNNSYLYYVSTSPWVIQVATDSFWSEIKQEALVQQKVLDDYESVYLQADKPPLYSEVRKLLRKARWSWSANQAYVDLELLGYKAVPAMIMLMDNKKSVGHENICHWTRSPNAICGNYHGHIENIHELLKLLLYLITGESFYGSHEQVCNAWRIYLHHYEELLPTLEQRAEKYKNPAINFSSTERFYDKWETKEIAVAGGLIAISVCVIGIIMFLIKRYDDRFETSDKET